MSQNVTRFISGLELNHRFYDEAVRPILARRFAALPHSAALCKVYG